MADSDKNDEIPITQGDAEPIMSVDANEVLVKDGGKWPGWPGTNVFRILIPSHKVGLVIGLGGENIKKMCDETKSRIKILDIHPNCQERAVIISAKEIPSASFSPAMVGLHHVLRCVIAVSKGEDAHDRSSYKNNVAVRFLVTSLQARDLIGKQGLHIKSIQDSSQASIRVLDAIPPFALVNDKVVEIHGKRSGVYKSVEFISSHLRKYLVDQSVIPYFEIQMNRPEQYWNHSEEFRFSTSGGFNNEAPLMPPFVDVNFYQPSTDHHFPLMERRHQHVDYRRASPQMEDNSLIRNHAALPLPPPPPPLPPLCNEVTQYIHIPLAYAYVVIGVSGATISYIRRTTGAIITAQETRGVPGELTIEINGSLLQVQAVQEMIKQYLSIAFGPLSPLSPPLHAQTSEVPVVQGYYPHPNQTSVVHMPTNPGMSAPPPAVNYNPSYENKHGY